jgi:hypothetical protein
MLFRALITVSLAGALIVTNPRGAQSQIIATPNIDKVCKSAPTLTHRRTVVYVDLASIHESRTEWGLTILNRLELAPRETLVLLAVNPSTFEISEVFDSCYPVFTSSEIDEARKSRSAWDKLTTLDPTDQQRENLQTFDSRLRNALDKIVAQAAKFKETTRRDILGALAFDKNRFSDPRAFYRLILYTDGIIKEPGIGVADLNSVSALTEKYPASFSGAEIAVFGIGGGAQDASFQSTEQVFGAFLLKSWARLKSFSSSLPQQQNFLFPETKRMDGTFEGGGTQGTVKLAVFAAKQGNIADGWLAFNVARETLYVPFQGDFQCEGEACTLSASCTESVPPESPNPYIRKGDRVRLSGKTQRSLEGSIEPAGREVFKDGKQNVRYALKFSF